MRVEIVSSIVSNPNGMKLEINYRNKNGINTKTWRLNNMLYKTRMKMKKSKKRMNDFSRKINQMLILYSRRCMTLTMCFHFLKIELLKSSLEEGEF